MSTSAASAMHRHRLGILHGAAIGAATFVIVFLLCWLGAVLGWSAASHLYLTLCTTVEMTSLVALGQGLCLSLGFGALVAIFHALFGFLAPR